VNHQVAQDSKEQAEMGKVSQAKSRGYDRDTNTKAGGGRKGERGEARGMRETELSKASVYMMHAQTLGCQGSESEVCAT
jgi:hypothetical protein